MNKKLLFMICLIVLPVFAIFSGCDGVEQKYTITWKNYDGTVLAVDENMELGTMPEYNGETPIREADETYTYTFSGWDREVVAVVEDATYTARYTPTYIDYTISFYNYDGELLTSNVYHYGDTVVEPDTPTKPNNEDYYFVFNGWDSDVVDVDGDATYTATFTPRQIEYTIQFVDYDGRVISTTQYHRGDSVSIPSDPSREPDNEYVYSFTGWDSNVELVNGDKIYTAVYSSERRVFTLQVSGNNSGDDFVHISKTSAYYDESISLVADNRLGYDFLGWYEGNNCVSQESEYEFNMPAKNINYTAKWSFWSSLTGFDFYSSGDELWIEGGDRNADRLTIPRGATHIANQAFQGYTNLNLIVIPDSVVKIGTRAFANCTNLSTAKIGNGLQEIGEYAFYNCNHLGTVHIHDIAAWCAINFGGDFTAFGSNSSNPISLGLDRSSLYLDENDTVITNNKITDLVIPNGVTAISDGAFFHCNIESVSFPDSVISIGNMSFCSCEDISSVTFGNGLKTIGKYAFSACGLESIVLPTNFETMDYGAFSDCGVREITILGNKITKLDGMSFSNAPDRIKINISSIEAWCNIEFNQGIYVFDLYLNGEEITELVIPNGVLSINDYAFHQCGHLTSVIIPDSVTKIGYKAFYQCWDLNNVVIGNGVQTIGGYAFTDCYQIDNITFGNNLQSIGQSAFENNGFANLSLPNSITEIGVDAFNKCESLVSANIPTALTNVGAIFNRCFSLETINIPNGVESLDGTFVSCSQLIYITIPNSLESIGQWTFYGCSNLKKVFYNGSIDEWNAITVDSENDGLLDAEIVCNVSGIVERVSNEKYTYLSINNEVYEFCINEDNNDFTSFSFEDELPGKVIKSIAYSGFTNCTNLKNIEIPNTVTEIGSGAFRYCSALKGVIIPNGVEIIWDNCFWCCNNIEYVVLPTSISKIREYAFSGCYNLAIYYLGTPSEWEKVIVHPDSDVYGVCYYSEETPSDTNYYYWHYVDNIPKQWSKA